MTTPEQIREGNSSSNQNLYFETLIGFAKALIGFALEKLSLNKRFLNKTLINNFDFN